MKKCILILLTVLTCALLGLSVGETATSTDSPFPLQTPDKTVTYAITDIGNGVDHGLVFFNNAANTASGVVLDRDGRPDNSWQGIGGYAFLAANLNVQPLTIWGSSDESALFTSPYPAQAPDQIQTFNDNQINGFDHGVIFFNNFAKTAMAVVLDPDGIPDNMWAGDGGYAFLAADFNTPPGTMWGSHNGLAWYCITGCNH